MRRSGAIGGCAVILLTSLAIAVLVTEIVSYSNNTLQVHPDWILGKRLGADPVMGSREAFSTRNLLSGDRLNLSAWHGYQELVLNRVFEPGAIRFRTRLSDSAYVCLIFGRNREGFAGVRISRNEIFPSLYFRALPGGKFTSRQPIRDASVSDGWHVVELSFEAPAPTLAIDGRTVARLGDLPIAPQVIGFRSGRAAAQIDDVVAIDSTGRVVIDESFRNDEHYATFLIVVFSIVAAMLSVLYGGGRRREGAARTVVLGILTFGFVAVVVSALYLAFDRIYWSKTYPYREAPAWWGLDIDRYELGFERWRSRLFGAAPGLGAAERVYDDRPESLTRFLGLDADFDGPLAILSIARAVAGEERIDVLMSNPNAVRNYLDSKPLPDEPRILFLGTSQTWGTGALRAGERIAPSVGAVLQERFGLSTTVINASKKGSRSGELLARYRDHLYLFRPTLVVVNLSNNDVDRAGFEANLQGLVDMNLQLGAQTLFVEEAKSPEASNLGLREKHAILRRVASRNGVPVVDLHRYLAEPEDVDSGISWWDDVHLTSYGQERSAEFLAAQIAAQISVEGPASRDRRLEDAPRLGSGS